MTRNCKGVVYVLALKHAKFYIGSTTYPEIRLKQHMGKTRSPVNPWIQKHGILGDDYLEIIKLEENGPSLKILELQVVLDYMCKYEMDNVRGSIFVGSQALEFSLAKVVKRLRDEFNDACWKCGKPGHMAGRCPNNSSPEVKKTRNCITSIFKSCKTTLSRVSKVLAPKFNTNALTKELEEELKLFQEENLGLLDIIKSFEEYSCSLEKAKELAEQRALDVEQAMKVDVEKRLDAEKRASDAEGMVDILMVSHILLDLSRSALPSA